MTDQLIMDNYLLVLKSNVEVFVHGTLESSNDDVRELLRYGLDTMLDCQADTYDTMVEYGWYKINNVETKDIDKTIQCIKNN